MAFCVGCGASIPEAGKFCPACGAATVVPQAPQSPQTSAADAPTVVSSSWTPANSLGGAGGKGQPRFIPGAIVSGRYRVIGLLGRGGMGEVYRADDLKLGQPVALKFLPVGLERDPVRLQQFLQEVRTARQITHPNVCRVYDVDDVDGQHFLSMEYVDGEDLASLLRRIGRLPHERAVEVAGQICTALAATHAEGILHRDLKPANVMIDGRGRVRLTDFGLAGLADSEGDATRGAGTPAYMAPEVIAGGEATPQSDVYALGLVLYELFTGKPAFEADSMAEFRRLHESAVPSSPSSHISDLDPAVETVMLRCLEKAPAARPSSAQAVAAALPGGDPLAAAIAAGQTPSPELVAEAGKREAMRWPVALSLAVVGLLIVFGATRWAATMTTLHWLPLDKRPEVMVDRAHETLATLGFDEPAYSDPVDHAWGLVVWGAVLQEVADADPSPSRWEGLRDRPDAAGFWYRQAPQLLIPEPDQAGPLFVRSGVGLTNPTSLVPGDASVMLDAAGRLSRFEVRPKRLSTVEAGEPDWQPLFDLAGLDASRFTEVRPRYQRFFALDHRRAWVGSRAASPNVELAVEAGSFEGRATLFNVAPVSNIEALGADPEPNRPGWGRVLVDWTQPLVVLVVALFAFGLAQRNVRQGRTDQRGAGRFAVLLALLFIVSRGLDSHGMSTVQWPGELWPLLAGGVFMATLGWVLYTAAEPVGRQVWPTMFVSSSRLLSRPRIVWRDPLIGASVLAGLIAGGLAFLVQAPVRSAIWGLVTGEPRMLFGYNYGVLVGPRATLAAIVSVDMAMGMSIVMVMGLVLLRLGLKKPWLAAALALPVWAAMTGVGSLEQLVYSLVVAAILLATLLRHGIVAMITASIVMQWAWLARASDWSAWHAEPAKLAVAAIVALAAYGVWAATGGTTAEPVKPAAP